MQLYSFFNSSTSYRVRIALALKGLDYQVVPVNLRQGEQLRPADRQRNPMGALPTLVDADGRRFSQSPRTASAGTRTGSPRAWRRRRPC